MRNSGKQHAPGVPRRVLLVRQWDSQHGGSGCCGRLGGADTELGRAEDYAHARVTMQEMGAVYRALAQAYPDADVTVVDPRNWAWLWQAVYRDARRAGLSRARALRQVSAATSAASVVVDGLVVSSRTVPSPQQALRLVADRKRHLERRPAGD